MKKLIYTLLVLSITGKAFSQTAVEGKVEYQKNKFRAAVMDVPYPQQQVEEAFDNYMKSKGSPGNNVKGYRLYRNVKISDKDNFYGDMYVGFEKKSRREKEATSISVIVGRPNETITNRNADDDYGLAQSKIFLNNMVAEVQEQNLNVEIAKQEEVSKKAEKKYNDLITDSTDYHKKLLELNDKISKNSGSLQQQRTELEKEQKVLESLKTKKKN